MCGIAGVIEAGPARGAADDLRHTLERMADAIARRGPDGRGFWVEPELGIALAHLRLAILDVSPAGAQPMQSACGRYVIVFNGEIYNHRELREELTIRGAAPEWRGHSDTESLLAAVGHWGLDEALRRTSGMFALALWDRSARKLALVRDRMGEKPLYWGWAGSSLVFASELGALRQHPESTAEVCRGAAALYLRFGYVPSPYSIHPGVYKLEPGCILEVNGAPPETPPDQPLRPGES